MIVVRLMGGVGNQMFQYAAGRALALRLEAPLRLDLSSFPDERGREFALGSLPLCAEVVTSAELECFPPVAAAPSGGRAARMLRRIACRVRGARRSGGPLRFREPHFHYASAFERLTGDVYLDGYWQSERYFAAASSTVAKELTLAEPQDARNAELAARILSSDSVSVHVRRGDYVHDPTLAGLYAELSPDWYRRAALMAASGLAAPEFFVFSDDPDWVRGHLDFGHPLTVVDHNAGAPLADMRLMSLCGRHVIANSSFSWWGAWLDRRPGAVVLAPAKWFGPRRARRRIDDLYPATWRRT